MPTEAALLRCFQIRLLASLFGEHRHRAPAFVLRSAQREAKQCGWCPELAVRRWL
jgi:hypothetical protein